MDFAARNDSTARPVRKGRRGSVSDFASIQKVRLVAAATKKATLPAARQRRGSCSTLSMLGACYTEVTEPLSVGCQTDQSGQENVTELHGGVASYGTSYGTTPPVAMRSIFPARATPDGRQSSLVVTSPDGLIRTSDAAPVVDQLRLSLSKLISAQRDIGQQETFTPQPPTHMSYHSFIPKPSPLTQRKKEFHRGRMSHGVGKDRRSTDVKRSEDGTVDINMLGLLQERHTVDRKQNAHGDTLGSGGGGLHLEAQWKSPNLSGSSRDVTCILTGAPASKSRLFLCLIRCCSGRSCWLVSPRATIREAASTSLHPSSYCTSSRCQRPRAPVAKPTVDPTSSSRKPAPPSAHSAIVSQ